MASNKVEDDERMVQSLYHYYKEKDFNAGKRDSIHRMIIASKLPLNKSLDSRKVVADYCMNYMNNFVEHNKITGLLLIYPNHALHVIESTDSTLLKVARHFDKMEMNEVEDKNLIFCRNKILIVSRCVNQRLYPLYRTKILDMEATNVKIFETSDPEHKVVSDILLQLTKLGVYLYKEAMKDQSEYVPEIFTVKLTKVLENIRDEKPELIPQQLHVGHFAEVSEDDCIMDLKEFIGNYERPYSTILESDLIWPAQRNNFLFAM